MSFWSYVARNGNYDLLGVQMHKKGPKGTNGGSKGVQGPSEVYIKNPPLYLNCPISC